MFFKTFIKIKNVFTSMNKTMCDNRPLMNIKHNLSPEAIML